MENLKVTARLTGMEELDAAMARAKKILSELQDAVGNVHRALHKVGLTVEQPPADTEG